MILVKSFVENWVKSPYVIVFSIWMNASKLTLLVLICCVASVWFLSFPCSWFIDFINLFDPSSSPPSSPQSIVIIDGFRLVRPLQTRSDFIIYSKSTCCLYVRFMIELCWILSSFFLILLRRYTKWIWCFQLISGHLEIGLFDDHTEVGIWFLLLYRTQKWIHNSIWSLYSKNSWYLLQFMSWNGSSDAIM